MTKLVLTISICFATAASATVALGAEQTIATGIVNIRGVAPGDFNNDGHVDFAVCYPAFHTAQIVENYGNGSFSSGRNLTLPSGDSGSSCDDVASADFDKDGDIDVVLTRFFDFIYLFENLGNGTFAEAVDIGTINCAKRAEIADINGDGWLDVVVSSCHGPVNWYENVAGNIVNAPSHTMRSAPVSDAMHFFRLVDLDEDGDPDLLGGYLASQSYPGTTSWWENTGNFSGSFGSEQVVNQDVGSSVASADVDGDGDREVITISALGNQILYHENFHADNGSAVFASGVVVNDLSLSPRVVLTYDFDSDGDDDLVCGTSSGSGATVFENYGNGTFGSQTPFGSSTFYEWDMEIADVNGDGKEDLVIAYLFEDKLSWFENLSPSPTPTDSPTAMPTPEITDSPTPSPTKAPTLSPTPIPAPIPTAVPTPEPSPMSTPTPCSFPDHPSNEISAPPVLDYSASGVELQSGETAVRIVVNVSRLWHYLTIKFSEDSGASVHAHNVSLHEDDVQADALWELEFFGDCMARVTGLVPWRDLSPDKSSVGATSITYSFLLSMVVWRETEFVPFDLLATGTQTSSSDVPFTITFQNQVELQASVLNVVDPDVDMFLQSASVVTSLNDSEPNAQVDVVFSTYVAHPLHLAGMNLSWSEPNNLNTSMVVVAHDSANWNCDSTDAHCQQQWHLQFPLHGCNLNHTLSLKFDRECNNVEFPSCSGQDDQPDMSMVVVAADICPHALPDVELSGALAFHDGFGAPATFFFADGLVYLTINLTSPTANILGINVTEIDVTPGIDNVSAIEVWQSSVQNPAYSESVKPVVETANHTAEIRFTWNTTVFARPPTSAAVSVRVVASFSDSDDSAATLLEVPAQIQEIPTTIRGTFSVFVDAGDSRAWKQALPRLHFIFAILTVLAVW